MKTIWCASMAASAIVLLQILTACHNVHSTSTLSNNFANRLLETQLRNAGRELEKIGNRLMQVAVQEMQLNANKVPLMKNVQMSVANALAQRGSSDLNSIARSLTNQMVRECYQLNKFTFLDAITAARAETLQCISDKFDEVNQIVESGRANITNAIANVQDVALFIGQCAKLTTTYPSLAGFIAKGACLNAALLSIQADTLLLPLNIAKRALEVRDSINRVQTDMTRCGLRIAQTISQQSIDAAKAIAKCISLQVATGTP